MSIARFRREAASLRQALERGEDVLREARDLRSDVDRHLEGRTLPQAETARQLKLRHDVVVRHLVVGAIELPEGAPPGLVDFAAEVATMTLGSGSIEAIKARLEAFSSESKQAEARRDRLKEDCDSTRRKVGLLASYRDLLDALTGSGPPGVQPGT